LVPVSREAAPPLSFAQQRLWFIDQLAPGSHAYNVIPYARLKGPLDVAALERSLAEVIRRHEALRTTFIQVNGQPVQRIAPELAFRLPVERLESVAEGEAELQRLAEEEARRPFDLEKGPLIRARLLRVTSEDHVLLLTLHHVISDVWSLGVMERELTTLYRAWSRGAEPALKALPVQYADYTTWQREWLTGEALEEQLAWWKRQLAGAPPVLELPTDRPRPPLQSARGAVLRVMLSPALSGAVKELSRAQGATQFMTLLAGFHALLARYSGQSDIVVGSPISGRNRREVEGLVGFFANTLALRVDGTGAESFRELLGRVRTACLGAYDHPELPFEQLVDALQPVRDLSRSPLFQVMFVLQGAMPYAALELPGLSASEFVVDPGVSRFDITLSVRETPDGWLCIWEYSTDLYDEATVARMAAHYVRLLEGAVAQPEGTLSALPLMDEAERRRVVVEFNDTRALYAPARGVHELFEVWADQTPGAVAVSFAQQRLTYAQLNQRANRLAHHLRGLGVGPDVPVGLCVRRSLELAVGVLAILKAGGAYVPLDPAYPAERLALMLESSRAPVVLTQQGLEDALPGGAARRLYLDTDEAQWAPGGEANPPPLSGPHALAYVIYTSGSTGAPKGVAMPHGPLLNMLRWQVERTVAPKGRTLQFSALSFDVSFQELFSTWAAGGELVLIPEELRLEARALLELMDSRGVERLFLPFVALQNLAEVAEREGVVPRGLKEVITAGEQLRVTPALRGMFARLPGCVLENQYGPTETHVATAYRLEGSPEQWPDLPGIGKPIANTSVHLLDASGEPVPVGVVGELYIGGAAVARGYLHREELTRERFLEDRFAAAPGGRLYRTGDYARYLTDGSIEFVGRRDAQVKVRGFRIELAEIEAALAKHPAVRDCIVDAREAASGQKLLVAYVVGRPGQQAPASGELKRYLKETLPEYMVPSSFVPLESLPLTPSGKVNRRALPAPDFGRQESSRAYVAPRTALEVRVARVWEELLGIHPIGVRDNFFELGGNSLLAIRLLSRIRTSLGRSPPVAALFQDATVEHLAGLLRQEAGPWSPLVELRKGDGRRPFFCVHAVGGTVLGYVELARRLGPEQPFYGLQSRGLDGDQEPCGSVEEMAALYLEAVRSVQPAGPYLLGGWSMGGTIALEMARQLQARGEQVEFLALIDSYDLTPAVEGVSSEQQESSRLGVLFYGDLLRAAGQEPPVSEEALARMGAEQLSGALEEASKAAASVLGAGVQPLQALRRVFEANLRAAWRYVPPRYEGRITLFEASESALRARGGTRFVATEVDVHTLEGDHYSLLRGPGVDALAARLASSLERAHAD
jgi:amino acid adenylation domain-containing protein